MQKSAFNIRHDKCFSFVFLKPDTDLSGRNLWKGLEVALFFSLDGWGGSSQENPKPRLTSTDNEDIDLKPCPH